MIGWCSYHTHIDQLCWNDQQKCWCTCCWCAYISINRHNLLPTDCETCAILPYTSEYRINTFTTTKHFWKTGYYWVFQPPAVGTLSVVFGKRSDWLFQSLVVIPEVQFLPDRQFVVHFATPYRQSVVRRSKTNCLHVTPGQKKVFQISYISCFPKWCWCCFWLKYL
jgi:hypothetical protein